MGQGDCVQCDKGVLYKVQGEGVVQCEGVV